jgi:hypothetical protein
LNTVTLNWNPADPGGPGLWITGYEIDVFASADATMPIRTDTISGSTTSATISGLAVDTPFWFTVSAKNDVNSANGPASARLGPLMAQGAVVANAGLDQTGVFRNTVVRLTGAGSMPAGATYTWTQVLTGTQTTLDQVVLTPAAGNPQDATFTLPFFKNPMVNSPLTFQLSVTANGDTKTDQVVITPHSDAISISSAKWKPGDFRIVGTSSPGSTVTVRSALYATIYGTAVADAAGAFDLRLRTNVPTTKPSAIVADSNMGGTSTPVSISG